MKYYLIGIVFILFSCNGQKKVVSEKDNDTRATSENPLTLLLQAEYSEFDVPETFVIRDQKRLKSLYSKINKTRKPGLPVPEIDFSKEVIIVACAGERNDDSPPVVTIKEETTSQMVLSTTLQSQEKNVANRVIANPFSIYKMPLSEKQIVFEEETP